LENPSGKYAALSNAAAPISNASKEAKEKEKAIMDSFTANKKCNLTLEERVEVIGPTPLVRAMAVMGTQKARMAQLSSATNVAQAIILSPDAPKRATAKEPQLSIPLYVAVVPATPHLQTMHLSML
jgi:hypothetical protein